MHTLAADAFAHGSQEIDGRNLRVETRQAPGERKPYEPRAGGGEMRPRRPQVRKARWPALIPEPLPPLAPPVARR